MRTLRLLLLALLLGAAALAWHTGWLSAPRLFEQATGWERIPPAERGEAALPWDGTGEAPQLRWLGHSGFLLAWHGARLLVDPNLDPRCTIARRTLATETTPAELGPVDAALISHAHLDHLDLPTLRAVPGLARVLVPRGSEGYVTGLGPATTVQGVAVGEAVRVGALEAIAVPAAHNGSRAHPLASAKLAVGWVVRAGPDAVYLAGDTGRTNDFEAIAGAYHPRVAVLPIGAYAPSFPMRRYHLSPEDAVEAARRMGGPAVVPCHFGTFALALDRPDAALPRFAAAAAAAGVRWTRPRP